MNPRPRPAERSQPDPLRLDSQLCFALYSASLMMTRAYRPLLAPLGLTYPQYLVMLALWETDDVTVGQLGERVQLDSGTLTPLLKRLETSGFISRRRARDDERQVRITLTDSGRQLKRQAKAIPQAMAQAVGCSAEELAPLAMSLKRIRATLSANDPG